MDILTLVFQPYEFSGFPKIKIALNSQPIADIEITKLTKVDIPLPSDENQCLTVERYGKTDNHTRVDAHGTIIADQMVELVNMKYNSITLPDVIRYQGIFRYNDQVLPQSTLFGPNGIWTFEFSMPFTRWANETSRSIKQSNQLLLQRLYQLRNKL